MHCRWTKSTCSLYRMHTNALTRDPWLTTLDQRKTPTESLGTIPAQAKPLHQNLVPNSHKPAVSMVLWSISSHLTRDRGRTRSKSCTLGEEWDLENGYLPGTLSDRSCLVKTDASSQSPSSKSRVSEASCEPNSYSKVGWSGRKSALQQRNTNCSSCRQAADSYIASSSQDYQNQGD